MANFWKIVDKVIKESDVVLEVLDARMVEETRNKEIEEKIKREKKKLIFVINKIDLVRNRPRLKDSVYVASKDRLGTTILKKKILSFGKKDIVVGVVGYPNTGKSSVINALAGRSRARTSSTSGLTRGVQKIKASERIYLLDTPGVFPYEKNSLAALLSKNVQEMKDPDLIAMDIIKNLKGRVEKHYGVKVSKDFEETIENIAKKMNRLKKGGIPDILEMSRTIIMDWQRGKI